MENLNILVVEDDANMRKVIGTVFKKAGHQIFEAEDGFAGLIKLKEAEIDVVFSDIMMPNLNGLEFLREAKKAYPFVEVVMLTAHSSPLKTFNSIEHGACEFLRKPFTIDELKKALEIAIENKQRKKEIMMKGGSATNKKTD